MISRWALLQIFLYILVGSYYIWPQNKIISTPGRYDDHGSWSNNMLVILELEPKTRAEKLPISIIMGGNLHAMTISPAVKLNET